MSGSYTVERELGGGGMSRVFLATETLLDRRVVIKVLPDEIAAGISGERFRREIQLAAKLQHPHIVPVLTAGTILGTPYFTMPFVDGESLRQRLDRVGELPLPEAVRLLREIASALAYAHKNGIVHRDIKPDNVMIADEFAVVTDFGVAKALKASAVSGDSASVTTAGVAIGTPAYMSPEQAVADPGVDHRADLYSFGILAYEILTGSTPFAGRTIQGVLAAHAIEIPEPIQQRRPNLAPWLASTIMRCLEKRPADRPQSAAELFHLLQESDELTRSGSTLFAPGTKRNRKVPLVAGAIMVAALLGVAAYLLFFRGNRAGTGNEIRSIAVLPLVNVGGTSQDEYFSDGMSDELANALNKIPGLRIASRTSSFTFKGRKDIDVEEIGHRLNVQAVLEGTVRRAGGRLRVTGQLTSTRDGLSLWSDSYERNASDVFAVQEEIARSISNALELRLVPKSTGARESSAGTENLQAYDAYLRGRYFWNARGAENLRKAVSQFDKAIAADPKFARAYAARAIAYALLPQYTDASPADALQQTRDDAARALKSDSTLAEAYTALGLASVNAWDWDTAEKSYRKAIAVDPEYPTAHQWYGELLYNTSRLDSSVAETRRAKNLDPLAPILATAFGYSLVAAGRYDEALVELRRGLEIAPNLGVLHAMTALASLFAGDSAGARNEMEIAVRDDPELVLRKGQLAYVYAMTGDRTGAMKVVEQMKREALSESSSQVAFAIAFIALGDTDQALTLLEKAARRHDIGLLTAASPLDDPTYAPVRNNPRFVAILKQMDLLRYKR
jgi:eukaryotic-like serine/threonine-protein kinase